jgi:hypothetical protein
MLLRNGRFVPVLPIYSIYLYGFVNGTRTSIRDNKWHPYTIGKQVFSHRHFLDEHYT